MFLLQLHFMFWFLGMCSSLCGYRRVRAGTEEARNPHLIPWSWWTCMAVSFPREVQELSCRHTSPTFQCLKVLLSRTSLSRRGHLMPLLLQPLYFTRAKEAGRLHVKLIFFWVSRFFEAKERWSWKSPYVFNMGVLQEGILSCMYLNRIPWWVEACNRRGSSLHGGQEAEKRDRKEPGQDMPLMDMYPAIYFIQQEPTSSVVPLFNTPFKF